MTLEQYRKSFSNRRFLNMPLAGLLCWSVVGIGSCWLSPWQSSMLLYAATGSVVYLAMLLSRFTKEPFFRKERNPFDRLFFVGLAMALLVFAIAIPFNIIYPRAITLTLGILTGLMWMPMSWIVQHWVGYFHTVVRTMLVLLAWYLFPAYHFQAVAGVIVVLYLISIAVLEQRWQRLVREDRG